LEITGSSGVAAALGLGVYLKEYGNCQVAWSDSQLNLSSPLPQVSDVLVRSANDRFVSTLDAMSHMISLLVRKSEYRT